MKKRLMFLVLFSLIFVVFLRPVTGDGDVFHHLATGKYVVTTHRLPTVDEWTFTAHGQPWVAHSWGSGVIFYLLYRTFGPTGISVWVAAMAVVTCFLLFLVTRSYLLLALAVPVLSTRFPNRPELWTYPMVLGFLLIDRYKNRYPRLVFLCPILTLLWANLYGVSVFIGLGLMAVLAGKQFLEDHYRIRTMTYYLCILVSFPLSLLNGYGLRTIFYIFSIPQIAQIQGEWAGIFETLTRAPLDYVLSFQYTVLLYLLYLVLLLLLVWYNRKKLRQHVFETILALAVIVPFFAFRHIPLAVILSLPLAAKLLRATTGRFHIIWITAALTVTIISLSIGLRLNPIGIGQDRSYFPMPLITFLREHNIRGRAFVTQQIGGFITYNLDLDIKVSWDTRDDLFLGNTIVTDTVSTFMSQQSIIPLLVKQNADCVIGDLTDGQSYQPLFTSPDWAIVYLRDKFFVAVPATTIPRLGLTPLDALNPFSFSQAKEGREEEALAYYESIPQSDRSSIDILRIARVQYALGQYRQSIATAKPISLGWAGIGAYFAVDRNYLIAQAAWMADDCGTTKRYLDATHAVASHKLIFEPWTEIPNVTNKGYTFFYLICQKNAVTGRKYLNSYLAQPNIAQEDKIETKKQFDAAAGE